MNRSADKFSGKNAFASFDQSTTQDWVNITKSVAGDRAGTANMVLDMLRRLKSSSLSTTMPVDVYDHSLQTATRAFQAGASEEVVVCALLHDVGALLAPDNHAELAAAILRPFVSDISVGVILLHEIFQGYHYFEKVGVDRNLRDRFRGHPSFEATVEFCEKWDQASFDCQFVAPQLEFFEPMVRRIFDRDPFSENRNPNIGFLGVHINTAPAGILPIVTPK
jgi:predicted HD phosphohydrolase